MEKNKNIESLFQDAFSEYREEISPEEMELMRQYTEKKAFYKFSLSRFNIYYATMICSCFVLSGYSAIKYFFASDYQPSVVLKEAELLQDNKDLKIKDELYLTGSKEKQEVIANEQREGLARKKKEKASTSPINREDSKIVPTKDFHLKNEKTQATHAITMETENTSMASTDKTGHSMSMKDSLQEKSNNITESDSPVVGAVQTDTLQKSDPVVIIVQDTIYKVDTVRSRLFSIFKRD